MQGRFMQASKLDGENYLPRAENKFSCLACRPIIQSKNAIVGNPAISFKQIFSSWISSKA